MLWKEHRSKMREAGVLRRIFGANGREITKEAKENLHNLED